MFRIVVPKLLQQQQRLWRHQVRGDTIIALGIPIACVGVLIEAYYRTDYNDANTSLEAQFQPSNDCIDAYHCGNLTIATTTAATSPKEDEIACSDGYTGNQTNTIVQTLERDGIVIIPNAISATTLSAVRDNIQRLQQRQPQEASPEIGTSSTPPYVFATSGNDTDVRQDKIMWIRNGTQSNTVSYDESVGSDQNKSGKETTSLSPIENSFIGQDLEYCISFVRGIPYALEKNGYTLSDHHRIPQQCQLSMYIGDRISSYQRHLDTCTATIYDLGLLEYWRLSDYRQRRITIILYLNESHRPIQHGGTLRCWVSKDMSKDICHQQTPPLSQSNLSASKLSHNNDHNETTTTTIFHPSLDVEPTGGTLVIFQSQRVEHQVLPSTVDRYALTNWVNSTTA